MRFKKHTSEPDYDSWKDAETTLIELPLPKFYFTVSMLTFGLVAYLVKDSLSAFAITVASMLAFAISVLLLHHKGGDGQKIEDGSAEPEGDAGATTKIGKADGGNGLRKHDGHSPPSHSGLRTPLESQKEETADNHS